MQTVANFNFAGKKALVRVDFNVPLNERFEITDDTRIKATIPTIQKILKDGGSVVLMSHLGRPKDGPTEKYSLKHLVTPLSLVFGVKVKFATDCISDEAVELAKMNTSKLENGVHIQDMSWPGYELIPNWIIEGYTTLCVETDLQLEALGVPPADLVAVPVGVGSFLHSVLAHYRSKPHRPVVLSVEPVGSACVYKSL